MSPPINRLSRDQVRGRRVNHRYHTEFGSATTQVPLTALLSQRGTLPRPAPPAWHLCIPQPLTLVSLYIHVRTWASFTIPGPGAARRWVRPHQPAPAGSPPTSTWCLDLPGSTGSSCSGPAGVEWAWGASPACLLGQSLSSFSAHRPPASISLVKELGYKQLCHQKPCHLLYR